MSYSSTGEKSAFSDRVAELGALALNPPNQSTLSGGLAKLAIEGAKNRLETKLTDGIKSALGPLGFLASFLIDAGKDHLKEQAENSASLKGIELLAQKNIPGMVYQEAIINGEKLRIGVDASRKISNPDATTRVIIQKIEKNSGNDDSYSHNTNIDLKNPDLVAKIEAMKNKAAADIDGFKLDVEARLPEEKRKYREEMNAYLDEIDKASVDEVGKIMPPKNPLGPEARYASQISEVISGHANELAKSNVNPYLGLVLNAVTP